MTKQAFIQELTKALAQVDSQTHSEIIADISEHFTEGVSHGLSEEDICKKLGQPSQIAEQVLEEYRQVKGQASAMHHNANAEFANTQSILMTDFDEVFAGVRSVDIDLNICNIEMVQDPQRQDIRVTIRGKNKPIYVTVENNNGCLYVNQKGPLFSFGIFGFKSKLEATIYVPASFTGDIRAVTSVGNITIKGLTSNLRLNTSAGNIKIQDHVCSYAHLRSSAGNIRIKNCDISQIEAKSSAGNVKAEVRETQNLTLSSSAGEVEVLATKLGGDTNLSSSAGTVYLEAQDVQGNITAKTSAGSVYIRLPREVNCRINAKKSAIGSVHNNLVGNPNSPYVLYASTSVGSVTLDAI